MKSVINRIIENRNKEWKVNPAIPSWVNVEKVDLDQFFTCPEIAYSCHKSLLDFMKKDGANISNYKFIEPSAGVGAFYDLLPKERRIGIDIFPKNKEFIKTDFLIWEPQINGSKYVSIGNPPFGYRGWLALVFMNHMAKFSEYVGMILPMAFQSDGKGSPKHRVKGLRLVHTEYLPQNSFVNKDGNFIKINALWQIWKSGEKEEKDIQTCDSWIDLFTVDMRKERLCGQEKMKRADFFIQRTFFKEPPSLVKDFKKVKYVCGYGLIIKKKKRELVKLLKNINWVKYSNLAAHNCRHISMYHIKTALIDKGYKDNDSQTNFKFGSL